MDADGGSGGGCVHQLIGHSPIQHLMIGLQLLCAPPFFYTHNLYKYKKLHQARCFSFFLFSLFQYISFKRENISRTRFILMMTTVRLLRSCVFEWNFA